MTRGAGRVTTEAVPGFEATVAVPDGQMVAVAWRDAPVGAVALRARTAGAWGDWVDLEADPDSAPEPASADASVARRTAVGPVWTGSGTDAVELRVTSGRLSDLRVDVLRADGSAPSTPHATTADTGRRGPPAIRPRSAWGAGPWRCSDPATSAPLRNAIVHHTASGNRYSASEVDDVLRGVYYFHTQSLGWCDVAYNFFVDRFGGIWEGRSGSLWAPIVGGHARGFNTGSLGVAVLGSYDGVPVPEAAFGALRRVIGWRLGGARLAPAGWTTVESAGSTKYAAGTVVNLPVISGHRDSSLTACPGSGLYTRLAELRLLTTADIGGGAVAVAVARAAPAPARGPAPDPGRV